MFFRNLLFGTAIDTAYFLSIIILFGLLLDILRKNTIRNFQRSFGRNALMITGLIGVPIHELSHAVIAFLFAHRITKIKLLQKPDENGVMGYVKHSYNQNSFYQQTGNFFIGIAPIFGGTFFILAFMHMILPGAYLRFISILNKSANITVLNEDFLIKIMKSYWELLKIMFNLNNFKNPYFYLFLFVLISISSHISLSSADIKGAARGIGVVFTIFLIMNGLSMLNYLEINFLKYDIILSVFLMIAVIYSVIAFIISLVL
jgi:hypothetical protein